ncbi:hypothetical protein T05_10295 [Trichinella murrelli]|uniref:Uncharacterized protein n=1 Tax=Trichinella murrelli TaxID=144512 RepID=A0A0V0TPG7_9BILA|nr:hypothetical protein T05_10295 [Trichinella murrelli]
MKWERRVDHQRQGFNFCFDQRRYQKIPQAECRQKSYRNCGCNLASIGQPHPLSHNGQLRPQALPSGYAPGQIKICIFPQAMPQAFYCTIFALRPQATPKGNEKFAYYP